MSETRHVLPINDLIDHEESEDCPCGPRVEPVERPDGIAALMEPLEPMVRRYAERFAGAR